MLAYLIAGTFVSLSSAADLSVLNEGLAPSGLKINKDGGIDKGGLSERRLGEGRTRFSKPDTPNLKGSAVDLYNSEYWDAEVARGKDGALTSVRAFRFEKAGLPTDEFAATLNHGSIVSITTCRHPGEKSCVTATSESCARVKKIWDNPKQFEKQRELCGPTLNQMGSIYDSRAVSLAHIDLEFSTGYATSPLAGIGTAFEAVANLKEVCAKYAKYLSAGYGTDSPAPAGTAK